MRVAPGDIKYMVTGVQKVKGIPTPGILSQDHATRQEAEAHLPTDSQYAHLAQVHGYVQSPQERADRSTYAVGSEYA